MIINSERKRFRNKYNINKATASGMTYLIEKFGVSEQVAYEEMLVRNQIISGIIHERNKEMCKELGIEFQDNYLKESK